MNKSKEQIEAEQAMLDHELEKAREVQEELKTGEEEL